jgi:manganese transport protein
MEGKVAGDSAPEVRAEGERREAGPPARPAGAAPGRHDAAAISAAQAVLQGQSRRPRPARALPFLGPAFIASIAYVDPGNFATNIQGGAKYGYLLLWVIVAANLMAMLIQALSAKLGIATGCNLAEVCRAEFAPPVVWAMWGISEVVAMATDLAEFLGAAIGLDLLVHTGLFPAALLTGVATFVILSLERRGFRPLEAVITAMIGIIAACYVVETLLDRPDWGAIALHAVTPQFAGPESIVLAAGILGATVMPHAINLHTALTPHRIVVRDDQQRTRQFRFEQLDVVIAMGLAGLVNAAMLIMAASTFYSSGQTQVGSIEEAYRTLQPLLGPAAGTIFAVSLLASGLSSSSVGTMAGQVIMQGYLHRKIPVWIRRLATMLPALIVIAIGVDPTWALVVSQVVLSFGIPFALIPLVLFTRRPDLMGNLVNRPLTTLLAGLVAAVIVSLNVYLLYATFFGGGL